MPGKAAQVKLNARVLFGGSGCEVPDCKEPVKALVIVGRGAVNEASGEMGFACGKDTEAVLGILAERWHKTFDPRPIASEAPAPGVQRRRLGAASA